MFTVYNNNVKVLHSTDFKGNGGSRELIVENRDFRYHVCYEILGKVVLVSLQVTYIKDESLALSISAQLRYMRGKAIPLIPNPRYLQEQRVDYNNITTNVYSCGTKVFYVANNVDRFSFFLTV